MILVALATAVLAFSVVMPSMATAQTTKPDGARVKMSESCKGLQGQAKSACEEGFGAGLGPKGQSHPEPTKDYNNDAQSDAELACGRFQVEANKNACIKGYKDGHYAYYHVSSTNPVALERERRDTAYFGKNDGKYKCGFGEGVRQVKTKFNLGCLGTNPPGNIEKLNAIEDMLYSFIRFLAAGVGIAVVISIIIAGIQYSTSEGNADTTQQAKDRIRNAMIGLLIYVFLFAIVQYLVPGGIFKPGVAVSPEAFYNLTGYLIK